MKFAAKVSSKGRLITIALATAAVSLTVLTPAARGLMFRLRRLPMRVLIVGGGPTADHNQVAIESNVRYVSRLLPADALKSTLFADGNINNNTVLYVDDVKALPEDQQALALIVQGNDQNFTTYGHYRKPDIQGSIDGSSTMPDFVQLMEKMAQQPASSSSGVLLYFTGHGSPLNGNLDNNHYDLWGRGGVLSVKTLAEQVSRLPARLPVTVIMAQCYSGAFGNLLFESGDPTQSYVSRDIVGYFAATKNRVAAGCTPAVNEADYHDFTSYFFAALTGQDRMGHRITGADYDHDGRIGMDEAFCYTLIHDESIDVPVCTSDVMVRKESPFQQDQIVLTPFSDLRRWATKAQRAALDGLSTRLNLTTEDRFAQANKMMTPQADPEKQRSYRQAADRFRQMRNTLRGDLLSRWPGLRTSGSDANRTSKAEAIALLAGEKSADARALIGAYDAMQAAQNATQSGENDAAAALRFVRLATSVVLTHRVMQSGTVDQKARLARLLALEHKALFSAAEAKSGGELQPDEGTTTESGF